ncbi:MAG TPA: hypothetical protein VN259_04780 [Xanthomonadales bacterium]|nr:hypothetical protein [Xanthomonadales bacterium]
MRHAFRWAASLVLLACGSSAGALDLRVGVGSGCTQATLQAALSAIEGVGGSHNIRINAGTYAVPDGMNYQPSVAQAFVVLEGGYASCTAATPSGSATSDAGRSIFSGSGGFGRSVLQLQINGLVGSFQMRRIALQDGDATNTAERFNHGGGLAVYGNASVQIGSGTSIRNNLAGHGGGVALVGSLVYSGGEALARPDFYIDEGAEIRNNTAVANGGGIYCGGAISVVGDPLSVPRHGSIVHRNGSILNNQAGGTGSAINCRGSYAGGGYQPRPLPGALALVANNGGAPGNFCAIAATLDLVVPVNGIDERVLGADDGSNGLLVISNNSGTSDSGLCVEGWGDRGGASPAPVPMPRFAIQNVWFSANTVSRAGTSVLAHSSALMVTAALELALRASGRTTVCAADTPCVLFENNAVAGGFPAGVTGAAVRMGNGATTTLWIERARFTGNIAQEALIAVQYRNSIYLQQSSVIDGNTVNGTDAVLFALRTPSGATAPAPDARLWHNTITGNSHTRFFRLDDNSLLSSQGNVLHAPATRLLRLGNAPAANLTLKWCNYLTTLSDAGFSGATQVADDFGPLVTVTGALALGADFAPPLSLIDQCQRPLVGFPVSATMIDYRGRLFGNPVAPANPNRLGDLGAIEFYSEVILRDGFEGGM